MAIRNDDNISHEEGIYPAASTTIALSRFISSRVFVLLFSLARPFLYIHEYRSFISAQALKYASSGHYLIFDLLPLTTT